MQRISIKTARGGATSSSLLFLSQPTTFPSLTTFALYTPTRTFLHLKKDNTTAMRSLYNKERRDALDAVTRRREEEAHKMNTSFSQGRVTMSTDEDSNHDNNINNHHRRHSIVKDDHLPPYPVDEVEFNATLEDGGQTQRRRAEREGQKEENTEEENIGDVHTGVEGNDSDSSTRIKKGGMLSNKEREDILLLRKPLFRTDATQTGASDLNKLFQCYTNLSLVAPLLVSGTSQANATPRTKNKGRKNAHMPTTISTATTTANTTTSAANWLPSSLDEDDDNAASEPNVNFKKNAVKTIEIQKSKGWICHHCYQINTSSSGATTTNNDSSSNSKRSRTICSVCHHLRFDMFYNLEDLFAPASSKIKSGEAAEVKVTESENSKTFSELLLKWRKHSRNWICNTCLEFNFDPLLIEKHNRQYNLILNETSGGGRDRSGSIANVCRCCHRPRRGRRSALDANENDKDGGDMSAENHSFVDEPDGGALQYVAHTSIHDEVLQRKKVSSILNTKNRVIRWRCIACRENNSLQTNVCRQCGRGRFHFYVQCPTCLCTDNFVGNEKCYAGAGLRLPPVVQGLARQHHHEHHAKHNQPIHEHWNARLAAMIHNWESKSEAERLREYGLRYENHPFGLHNCFAPFSFLLSCRQCDSSLHGGTIGYLYQDENSNNYNHHHHHHNIHNSDNNNNNKTSVNSSQHPERDVNQFVFNNVLWLCACGCVNITKSRSCLRCRLPREVLDLRREFFSKFVFSDTTTDNNNNNNNRYYGDGRKSDVYAAKAGEGHSFRFNPSVYEKKNKSTAFDFENCSDWLCHHCEGINSASYYVVEEVRRRHYNNNNNNNNNSNHDTQNNNKDGHTTAVNNKGSGHLAEGRGEAEVRVEKKAVLHRGQRYCQHCWRPWHYHVMERHGAPSTPHQTDMNDHNNNNNIIMNTNSASMRTIVWSCACHEINEQAPFSFADLLKMARVPPHVLQSTYLYKLLSPPLASTRTADVAAASTSTETETERKVMQVGREQKDEEAAQRETSATHEQPQQEKTIKNADDGGKHEREVGHETNNNNSHSPTTAPLNLNAHFHHRCRGCGLPGLPHLSCDVLSLWRRGDWLCCYCGKHNYRDRAVCMCGAARS